MSDWTFAAEDFYECVSGDIAALKDVRHSFCEMLARMANAKLCAERAKAPVVRKVAEANNFWTELSAPMANAKPFTHLARIEGIEEL